MIIKKTSEEIEQIEAAGKILVETLALLGKELAVGVTTEQLDALAEDAIRSQGATPVFKGYKGFPASICASPNALIVHGIPGPYRLQEGDIISIDVGVELNGWIADAAYTFPVGAVSEEAQRLLSVTEQSLLDGAQQCFAGNRMGDLSAAVQARVEDAGFSVVRSLVGHGVGREMHEDPQVPNFGKKGTGIELSEGMVIAVEPMVTVGSPAIRMGSDNWSIFSQDDSLAAHFEFTIAIQADGPRVLTPWHLPGALG